MAECLSGGVGGGVTKLTAMHSITLHIVYVINFACFITLPSSPIEVTTNKQKSNSDNKIVCHFTK